MEVVFGNPAGASPAPVIEKIVTPTPVDGVVVESVNSVCPAPPVPQVPAVRHTTALAPVGLVLGDRIPDFKEIILPRLNIVQNIGELKDTFQPGALVYNKDTELFTPPIIRNGVIEQAPLTPVNLVVLGFRPTRFVEKVKGGGQGLIVDTEDAVRANGGTLDYNEHRLKEKDGMKRFEQLAEALVAIRRPDHCKDDDTVFTYLVGGHKYALGLWGMKGTSYTVAKRAFFTPRAMGCLKKGGYPSYHFAVTTKEETYPNGNKAWIPICIPTVQTDTAFLEFAGQILNG